MMVSFGKPVAEPSSEARRAMAAQPWLDGGAATHRQSSIEESKKHLVQFFRF
jgi:hypothetical protein